MLNWMQKPLCVAALLAVAVAAMLHGNLHGPFYGIDDNRYIPHAAGGSWGSIFVPRTGILYGPVTYISLRIDRILFGPSQDEVLRSFLPEKKDLDSFDVRVGGKTPAGPSGNWAWGPRLMNGVYHGIAGLLLWYFFTRLGLGAGTSLFISFAWTAHPTALESVAWVCERKNVMCALWGFAALVVWTSDREWKWRWPLVWFFFALSLFSKLAALSFIPILGALELFDPRRTEPLTSPRFWGAVVLRFSVIVALSAGMFMVSMKLFKDDIASPPGGSPWTGLLTDADIFGRYVLNSIVPLFNSFFYGVRPIKSLADARLWIYGLLTLLFWAGLFRAAKPEDRRWVGLGLVWFYFALGPNSNIMATAFPMQDRYTYIPMPGLLLAFAMGMRGLIGRVLPQPHALAVAGAVYCAVVFTISAIRSPLYRSSDVLSIEAVQRQPDSGFGVLMLIQIMTPRYNAALPGGSNANPQKARELGESLVQYYNAAELTPDFWQFSSPIVLRVEKATLLLALQRDRDAASALLPMLRTAEEMKGVKDAKVLYPDLPSGFQKRFQPHVDRKFMRRGWLSITEAHLRISLRRDTPPGERLAFAQRAVEGATNAVDFDPKDPDALMLLGRALIRTSDLLAERNEMAEALRVYNQAREVLQREPVKTPGAELLKKMPPPEAPKPPPASNP